MKLIILFLIIVLTQSAQFEIGSLNTGNIKGHKIYKQDVQFREQFQNIPKIALSMSGFQSKSNALDFFSRTTEITNQGFQLQVISDVEIEQISFNYLATENEKVQVICNNIEVKKDQIDIKYNQAFDEIPQVATFITGVHKITQDDLILHIKSIEKDQVHLITKSKAESSIGICLLVGPHDVFINRDLNYEEIQQRIPNSVFYGVSSVIGQPQNGIQINLNNINENTLNFKLNVAEMTLDEQTKQQLEEQNEVTKTVQFDDLVNQLSPQSEEQSLNEQPEQIKSMQFIFPESEETQTTIQSITFVNPEQKYAQYFEDENQSTQLDEQQNQELMIINETWLQHDILVIDSSNNSNSIDDMESSQQLTNLIKPEDFNENQIDQQQSDSFIRQPENVIIIDSTDLIVNENKQQMDIQNIDYSTQQDEQQNYVTENQEQIQSNEKVEQLEDIVQDLKEEVQNLSKSNNPQTLNDQDSFDIIQQQKFIVEQQKQLVEQQQQIIQQYQHIIEEQKKIIDEKFSSKQQPNDDSNNEEPQNTQEIQEEESQKQEIIQDKENNLEEPLEVEQKDDIVSENLSDHNNQDNQMISFDNEKQLEKDLASFDRLKVKKIDESNEKQITQILNNITENIEPQLTNDEKLNNIQEQLEDVVDLLNNNDIENVNEKKFVNQHVEYSNSKNQQNTQIDIEYSDLQKINIQDQHNLEPENITLEELSETIFANEYEVESAYFDWSLKQNYQNQKQKIQSNQELLQQQNNENEQSQKLQQQIQEFLELDSNDQSFSDPLIDEFHSFFSVNQKIKNNLRKRRVLNV